MSRWPHDAPPAETAPPGPPVCGQGHELCGSACVVPDTDNDCGACTACTTGTHCYGGDGCVPYALSCADARAANPDAPCGAYTNVPSNGFGAVIGPTGWMYCDMSGTTPVEYDDLAIGRFDASYAGYSMITGAALQTAGAENAFLLFLSKLHGAHVLETWAATSPCIATSSTGGSWLLLGTSSVGATDGTTVLTSFTQWSYDRLELLDSQTIFTTFAGYPPSDGAHAGCSTGGNPALFFQTR